LAAEVEEARRELRDLVADGRDRNGSASLAADLRERIRDLDGRGRKLDARLTSMRERAIDEDELAGALESFDPLWEQLNAAERERMVRLLVKCVEWDAVTETVTVTFNADSEVWEEDVCLI
jgi:hypothetical protein